MTGEDEARRIALNLACVAAIAVAAPPMGWTLAQWFVMGNLAFFKSSADHWLIVPDGATLALAIMAVTKMPKGPLRLLVPVVIVALIALGAWQSVSVSAKHFRDTAFNAIL
jgi:hypothetical protein